MTRCAVFIVALLALAACGRGGQGTVGEPVSVSGYVGLDGGPVNPTTGDMALQDSPAAQVHVVAMSGTVTVASAVTGNTGRFTLRLAPGRYLIKAGCGVGRRVVVHERTLQVTLRCDVP